MHRLAYLMMLALLVGTIPASAQDGAPLSPRVRPDPIVEPDKIPAARKSVAVKPAAKSDVKKEAAVTPPTTPRPKAAPVKPARVKSVAVKPKSESAEPASEPFAGIPPAERRKILAALLWSGDYPGAASNPDPMLTAIKNFQKRNKSRITGVLTPAERAALLAAAETHEQEFGWSVVIDPATGIRIGLPTKLVPLARDAAHGTRWSSKHGEVQVETFRIKDPDLKLSALFEREKKTPATRRVETSVLHDDNFFISGLQGLKIFSVRATIRDGEVRGFTMLFDQMMETIVAPVMVAMSSAFSPFPERSMPFAALTKRVEYGNGLVVSAQGHIVTDHRLTQDCQVIVAAGLGNADRIADDQAKGLALLRIYGPAKVSPLLLPRDAPAQSDLTLIGIPDPKEQNGNHKLTEIKARLVDGTAIELRQPVPMAGFSGAAALDGHGHFLGMMEMRDAVLASVEASAPPVRLVTGATIRAFLAAHDVTPATTQSTDSKASVVRVICVRK
jgi:hypothetical protein